MASTVIQDFLIAIGIDVDQNKLQKVLDKFGDFKDTLKTLATGTGLGLVIQQINKVTQSIVEATQATAEWATDLDRTAKKSGVTADVLQRLQLLEKEYNISEGTTESALQNIYEKQVRARTGQGYDEGFLRAGIGLGGTPAEVLQRIIDMTRGKSEQYKQYIAMMTGIDRNLFELEGADISKIEPIKLINEEDQQKLKDVNKEFGKLNAGLQVLKQKFLIASLPLVEKLLEIANKYLKQVLEYLDEVRKDEELMNKIKNFLTSAKTILVTIGSIVLPVIIKSLFIVGKFLLTGIFSPLGKILKLVIAIGKAGAIMSWFSIFGKSKDVMNPKSISLFAKAFRGLGIIINTVTKGFLKLTASILTSPITWLIAGISALAVILGDLINVAMGGEATITRWLEDTIGKKFPSIGKGIKWLRENIEGFFESAKQFFTGIYELCGGLKDLVLQILALLWNKFKSYISDSVDYILQKYNAVKGIIKKLNPFGSDEDKQAMDKKLAELEAKARAQKEIEDKKRYEEIQPMVAKLMNPTVPQYITTPKATEQNLTINNTNNFEFDNVDDPAQVATQIKEQMYGRGLTSDINKASIVLANGGR